MGERRRCEGIIVDRPSHLPFWKRCTAFAMVGLDYCVMCFQRRVQNDAARACLLPGWEKLIVGDESRKGKGKPRLGLEQADKEAAATLRAQRTIEVEPAGLTVKVTPPGTTEPILLDRKRKAVEPAPPPPEPDDIFASARKALAAVAKI